MIDGAILALLSASTAVSTLTQDRIYPINLPQGAALPAIAFSRLASLSREYHHGAPLMAREIFQISCFASSALVSKQLADGVISALRNVRGAFAGKQVCKTRISNALDVFDFESNTYQAAIDIEITFIE